LRSTAFNVRDCDLVARATFSRLAAAIAVNLPAGLAVLPAWRRAITEVKVMKVAVHVVSDGLLITGQNPASSGPAAKTLMAAVRQKATLAGTARAL
jgi:putative intracellular protease/amidase